MSDFVCISVQDMLIYCTYSYIDKGDEEEEYANGGWIREGACRLRGFHCAQGGR
jgi:hypothetical protein